MDCIFCDIVAGRLPSKKVLENDNVLAFYDIQPAAPVHVLFIPKRHIASMNDVQPEDGELIVEIHRTIQQAAKQLGVDESGYRIVNNCGEDGGQVVHHLHYHLLAGAKLGPLNS